MRFTEYTKQQLLELKMNSNTFNKVDIDDFNIGFEFEFLALESRHSDNVITRMEKTFNKKIADVDTFNRDQYDYSEPDQWYLMDDASIQQSKDQRGWEYELCTAAVTGSDALVNLKNVFQYINEYGWTNASTGLHINISFKDHNKTQDIDPLKVAVLTAPDYLIKTFRNVTAGMMDNSDKEEDRYFKSNIERIKNKLNKSYDISLDAILKNKTIESIVDKVSEYIESYDKSGGRFDTSEKYQVVNLSKLRKGYIEFRVTGGKDYQKRYDETVNAIKRYLTVMNSSISDIDEHTYAKKLYKIIVDTFSELDISTYDEKSNTWRDSKLSMNDNKDEFTKKVYFYLKPYADKNKQVKNQIGDLINSLLHQKKDNIVVSLQWFIRNMIPRCPQILHDQKILLILHYITKKYKITASDINIYYDNMEPSDYEYEDLRDDGYYNVKDYDDYNDNEFERAFAEKKKDLASKICKVLGLK